MEERSGERNADGGLQVQLEEDGGDSTSQSWMEIDAPLGVRQQTSQPSQVRNCKTAIVFLKLFPLVTRPLPAAVDWLLLSTRQRHVQMH